eukprot:1157343-Pelagomonas_calceolata.AAC.3
MEQSQIRVLGQNRTRVSPVQLLAQKCKTHPADHAEAQAGSAPQHREHRQHAFQRVQEVGFPRLSCWPPPPRSCCLAALRPVSAIVAAAVPLLRSQSIQQWRAASGSAGTGKPQVHRQERTGTGVGGRAAWSLLRDGPFHPHQTQGFVACSKQHHPVAEIYSSDRSRVFSLAHRYEGAHQNEQGLKSKINPNCRFHYLFQFLGPAAGTTLDYHVCLRTPAHNICERLQKMKRWFMKPWLEAVLPSFILVWA